MDLDRAYAQFLDNFDAGLWLESVQSYTRELDKASESARVSPQSLRRGLCISIFVQWLAWLAGQTENSTKAEEHFKRLSAELRKRHRTSPSPDTGIGIGVLLSSLGYAKAGARCLSEGALAQPEIALLFEPNGLARKTAFLRSFVFDGGSKAFRPALFRYCDALLGLGAVGEVRKLMTERGGNARDGVFAEIVGRLHEQEGEWQKALDIYGQSPWPRHAYRATLCKSILKGAATVGARDEISTVGPATASKIEMSAFQSEIDQAELSRATAFVNACQWNPIRDWLIYFELGKLSFRRRRYCEAEANFGKAVATAPAGHRFPILSLRFSNLTWLSSESLSRQLPMTPEALASGREALACRSDPHENISEDEVAHIQVWLAGETEEKDLLQPVLESRLPQIRSRAHELKGNLAPAMDCLLQSFEEGYNHRALQRLVSICHASELEQTAHFLAEVVIEESWDDFFVLWELGTLLLNAAASSQRTSAAGGEALDKQLERVMRRVEELGRFDFQNLLRAHEFFSSAGHQEVAESLLNRAAKLADGAEENLAIAVVRRRVPRVGKGEVDAQGLACLQRAAEESRDRLERLQIARELFYYGQPQRARRILAEDRILAAANGEAAKLTLIEGIVALSCHQWLRKEEVERLAQDAVDSLGREIESGSIVKDAARFVRRLYVALYTADEVLTARLRSSFDRLRDRAAEMFARAQSSVVSDASETSGAALPDARDDWSSWRTAVSAAVAGGNADGEVALLESAVNASKDASAGFRIALWSYLSAEMKRNLAAAQKVRPELPADRTPFAKSNQRLDLRSQELCDRWRAVLVGRPGVEDGQARKRLAEFYQEEEELLEKWEESRSDAASVALRRVQLHARLATQVLASMVENASNDSATPLLCGFYDALAMDSAVLQKKLAARLSAMAVASERL
jgi:hypothetical protein